MAKRLGISAAYVNLLEGNQRSLSVQVLVAITEAYGVDWRDLIADPGTNHLTDLRAAMRDPVFAGEAPDLQELRAAIDHAPRLISRLLHLYQNHRALAERINRISGDGAATDLVTASPERVIHDFFRDHANHFDVLERRAEALRDRIGGAADDMYASLKRHLRVEHGLQARVVSLEELPDALRLFDREAGDVLLSEALDHTNRVFQLAHVLGLQACNAEVETLADGSGIADAGTKARLKVELTNYFAAALLMPYTRFHRLAETSRYDIDRLSAAFAVSFEQVCHRLTTLQRDGARGIPFFFLRVDRAGNVTKRFNATGFTLAEQGGSCPVWDMHAAFRAPGVIHPQFVELPDGSRYFTLSRTTDRPVFNRQTQDRRLVVALGCDLSQTDRIGYADPFNQADAALFMPIGIACSLCPRQACSQRAHEPLHVRLQVDTDRRGRTRYES